MPKSWNNIFERVCSEENLKPAFRKARRGKSSRSYAKEFETNLDEEISKLREELLNQTYHPKPLYRFVISDPKTRVIHAPAFRDRVVHHAICNIIEPLFDKTFIFDSYASRKGKGTHAALERFEEFKHRVTRSGTLVPHAPPPFYEHGHWIRAEGGRKALFPVSRP